MVCDARGSADKSTTFITVVHSSIMVPVVQQILLIRISIIVCGAEEFGWVGGEGRGGRDNLRALEGHRDAVHKVREEGGTHRAGGWGTCECAGFETLDSIYTFCGRDLVRIPIITIGVCGVHMSQSS